MLLQRIYCPPLFLTSFTIKLIPIGKAMAWSWSCLPYSAPLLLSSHSTSHLSLETFPACSLCSALVFSLTDIFFFFLPEFGPFLLFKIQPRFFLRRPFWPPCPREGSLPPYTIPLAPSLPSLPLPCHFLSHSLVYALSHGTLQYLKLPFHVSGFNFLLC